MVWVGYEYAFAVELEAEIAFVEELVALVGETALEGEGSTASVVGSHIVPAPRVFPTTEVNIQIRYSLIRHIRI